MSDTEDNLTNAVVAFHTDLNRVLGEHGPKIQDALREANREGNSEDALRLMAAPLVSSWWMLLKGAYPKLSLEKRAKFARAVLDAAVDISVDQDVELAFHEVRLN